MSNSKNIAEIFKTAIKSGRVKYTAFNTHFNRILSIIWNVLNVLTCVLSLVCIIGMIAYLGFDTKGNESLYILQAIRVSQTVFIVSVIYNILFRRVISGRAKTPWIKYILEIFVLLTLLPILNILPNASWLVGVKSVIYSKAFTFMVLGAYSVFTLSIGVMSLIGRRTNPSLILAGSFLFFIIVGAFMFMMPGCTVNGYLPFEDALFVSSSAVCITGLTTVDIAQQFTPLGLCILATLIQIGGLGVLTFTSFFALFFSGSTSIYNQLMMRDLIYSKSMNTLIPTMLYILGFTLTIELMGAVAIYFTLPEALYPEVRDRVFTAAFHALSSFCNAGFSSIENGMSNAMLMNGNQSIYIVTSVLIFAGAIGFPILVNFKDITSQYLKRIFYKIRRTGTHPPRIVHIYDMNTKVVLITTVGILVIGSVLFFVFEYNNTLQGMSTYKKAVQSVFNSLTPRSAGFASVNPSSFLNITLLIVLVQMVIGGASQSMAGGIKVNTVGTVLLSLRSAILGHKGVAGFKRRIAESSIKRANAVIVLAFIAFITYSITIMILEPELSTRSVIFEVTSAIFTVGSSMGITPQLSIASKIVLCTAMFVGRVGIISILCGIAGKHKDYTDHVPTEYIIIN